MRKITSFLLFCTALLFGFTTNAQNVLFSEDFELQDANSSLTVGELGTSNVYDLATDYSTVSGISTPTNVGSYGAKIAVNTSSSEASAVGLFPTGMTFTPPYTLSFDAWMNQDGQGSTTEFIYYGVQHATTSVLPTDGVDFAITADCGSSRDLRVYDSGTEVTFDNCNACYPIGLSASYGQNTGGAYAAYPEYTAVLETGTTDPSNQWIHYTVIVTATDVTFNVNGATWGHYDVSNTTPANIMVGYADLFSSVGNANSFILIDNIKVVDNSSQSVSEGQIEGFEMYPNPSDDVLNIKADSPIDQVYIYNVYGQEVLQMNLPQSQIDISALKPGTYFVKVQVGDTTQTNKLIKK